MNKFDYYCDRCPKPKYHSGPCAVTPPKPIESPQEIEKALEDLYKPRDKHDEILFKSGQNHFNEGNTEHPPYPGADTWADIMTNQGWVYAKRIYKLIAARPAHIDTTAPVEEKCWACGFGGVHLFEDGRCFPCYAEERTSADPKPAAQPNELAAAQARIAELEEASESENAVFQDLIPGNATLYDRIVAQQAKITELEEKLRQCANELNHVTMMYLRTKENLMECDEWAKFL